MLIKLKWNKLSYDIELDPSAGVELFKSQIQSLTGVPPERQKLMGKGLWSGILKDDADISTLKFNPGHIITLMGTADVVKEPVAAVLFVEDMTDAQKAEKGAVLPAGLKNLGNTCYMNSILQCIRNMPDLRAKLALAPTVPRSHLDGNLVLSNDLRDSLNILDRSAGGIIPMFVPSIRERMPIFSQRTPQGGFMQQDAEEFFNSIIQIITSGLHSSHSGMDEFLEISFENKLKCLEAPDEPEIITFEKACKLICNIQGSIGSKSVTTSINHMHEGINLALEGSLEKHSNILGRNAQWSKSQKISSLPKYLCVHFMRFFWKATPDSRDHAGVKCKIVRAVNFPETFDIYNFCTDGVQAELRSNRLLEEKRLEEIFQKKRALDSEIPKAANDSISQESADIDDEAALAAALALSVGEQPSSVFQKSESSPASGLFNKGVPRDFTGNYELFGVVTHKGRDADSGHYIGWVRQAEGSNTWWKFDDDIVSEIKTEEVLALRGGGDWHTAYLNFYRIKTNK